MVDLLTRDQIEREYRVKKSRLEALAHQGLGPIYYKPGRHALYPRDRFEVWLASTTPNLAIRRAAYGPRKRGKPRAARMSNA